MIIANECIFQEIGENLIRLTSTKPAKQLLAAGEFIHRTFGHSSVANGDLASTDYMTPLFNWERRFRINIEKYGRRNDMLISSAQHTTFIRKARK